MAGNLNDILAALQNGVNAIRDVSFLPPISGQVISVNNLSTTAVSVLTSTTVRTSITFHNPSVNGPNVFVYPTTPLGGGTNTPTLSALGGSFAVLPGAFLCLTDGSSGSWFAFSSSGSSIPLTVMVSND